MKRGLANKGARRKLNWDAVCAAGAALLPRVYTQPGSTMPKLDHKGRALHYSRAFATTLSSRRIVRFSSLRRGHPILQQRLDLKPVDELLVGPRPLRILDDSFRVRLRVELEALFLGIPAVCG